MSKENSWKNFTNAEMKIRSHADKETGNVSYFTTLAGQDKDGGKVFLNVPVVFCKGCKPIEKDIITVTGFISLNYTGNICLFVQAVS